VNIEACIMNEGLHLVVCATVAAALFSFPFLLN
jgi:hypothetical protein